MIGIHETMLKTSKKFAKKKMTDLNTSNLEAAMKTIEGTAKSMGVNRRIVIASRAYIR